MRTKDGETINIGQPSGPSLHNTRNPDICRGKKKICWKTICDDVVSLIIHPPYEGQVPVVQSLVSLTSSLRGQLVKCFMIL